MDSNTQGETWRVQERKTVSKERQRRDKGAGLPRYQTVKGEKGIYLWTHLTFNLYHAFSISTISTYEKSGKGQQIHTTVFNNSLFPSEDFQAHSITITWITIPFLLTIPLTELINTSLRCDDTCRSCQACSKLQVSSLSSLWAVTEEHRPLEPGIKTARPADLGSNYRAAQLMTCDPQTHLSSNHITNLLDPKPKEFMVFQGNMIFTLTVSHSCNPNTDKELKFLFSRLSWDQALWWKEITGNPSLGLEVWEAETRHPHSAPQTSGKIPSITALAYQSHTPCLSLMSAWCWLAAPNVSGRARGTAESQLVPPAESSGGSH